MNSKSPVDIELIQSALKSDTDSQNRRKMTSILITQETVRSPGS